MRGKKEEEEIGGATRVVLSGSTPLHCRQLSPRVPLCRLNYRCWHRVVLYPEFGPSLVGHSRDDVYPYMFFVHPYSVLSSLPFLQFHLSFLPSSSSYSLFAPHPDFIYPVRVAWTLTAFKYRNVFVVYDASLMSPPGSLSRSYASMREKQLDLYARRSSTPRQFARATSAVEHAARARLPTLMTARPIFRPCPTLAAPLCQCHAILYSAQRRRFYLLYLHIACVHIAR